MFEWLTQCYFSYKEKDNIRNCRSEAGKSFPENVLFSPTGLKKKSSFYYFVILLFTEKLLTWFRIEPEALQVQICCILLYKGYFLFITNFSEDIQS